MKLERAIERMKNAGALVEEREEWLLIKARNNALYNFNKKTLVAQDITYGSPLRVGGLLQLVHFVELHG